MNEKVASISSIFWRPIMFWLTALGAFAILALLVLLGGWLANRNPDTAWERHEDRPIIGGGHDHF